MAENKVRGVCHLDCPDTCGMISTVRDGVLVRVEGDPEHPITQGFLCTKVLRLIGRVYGKERDVTRKDMPCLVTMPSCGRSSTPR